MSRRYIFSSESVGEGHPDKVCDTISDAILDACLAIDKNSRVACETFVKSNTVVVGGEITIPKIKGAPLDSVLNIGDIIRKAIRGIGYVNDDDVFHADRVFISNLLTSQSPDIAQGVDDRKAEGKATAEQGAGDQGLMFGYACNDTEELMPLPIALAHRITNRLTEARFNKDVNWLRPDSKSQVSIVYDEYQPIGINNVVVSTQHSPDVTHSQIKEYVIEKIIKPCLPPKMITPDIVYHINPTGNFVVGGPHGDSGLTGRKIIVDTYGGWGRHGGGAFSGKDPTKVDRSAAYMARHVAKTIVASGLADRCEVQLAYAIGVSEPVSVRVDTQGSGKVSDERICQVVKEFFKLTPRGIIEYLDLRRPIYVKTSSGGHFGRNEPEFTWESTKNAAEFAKAVAG